jgi:hypothetical protein
MSKKGNTSVLPSSKKISDIVVDIVNNNILTEGEPSIDE